MSHVQRLSDQAVLPIPSPPIIHCPTVVPDIDDRLSKRMSPREFYVHTVPRAREVLGMSDVRDSESVVQWWTDVKTKRVLVCIGEESDEGGECEPEVADWHWDGESIII